MYSLELKLMIISWITRKLANTFFGAYNFSTMSSQMASFCSLSYSLFVTPSFETFCSLNLLPDWGPYIWAFHFFPFLAEFGSVLALDNHLASDLWAIQSHQWKVSALSPCYPSPICAQYLFAIFPISSFDLFMWVLCSLWSTSSVFHFLYTLVSLLHYPSYLKEIVYIIITNFLNIPSAFTICSSLPFYALSSQHAPVI